MSNDTWYVVEYERGGFKTGEASEPLSRPEADTLRDQMARANPKRTYIVRREK